MKKINASFNSKDYSKKYSMTAAVRRGFANSGDPKALPLVDNELSHDDIVIKVCDSSPLNLVATCHAHVSEVTANTFPLIERIIYSEARQASVTYASSLLNAAKASFTQYDAPTIRVLTIETIEVNENYRRQGIATSIIDYLHTLINPEIIVGLSIPYFTPTVSSNVTSLAATDIHALDRLLTSLGFDRKGKVKLMGAGTPIEVENYVWHR